jgi:multidrug efflux pump subunit AcrA (membrane-fusion protein)
VTGLILLTSLAGCSLPTAPQPTPTPAPEPPQPAAPTYTAQRGLVVRQVQFSARIQPKEAQQLAFDIDGRVRKLTVRGGDAVKVGDVLAELDLTDLRTQIQQETIKLRTAQTVLSDTIQAYTRTIRLAELDLEQARLRLASATSRNTRSNIEVQANDLARNAKLIEDIKTSIANARAIGNQAGAYNAQRLLTAAEIERERLQANYNNLLAEAGAKNIDIGLLRNEVERAQINLESRIAKLDPGLVQAVETSRTALEALQTKEARGTLISPLDGTVTALSIAVGETSGPSISSSRGQARRPRDCRRAERHPTARRCARAAGGHLSVQRAEQGCPRQDHPGADLLDYQQRSIRPDRA